jgi:hypothetical protein
LWQNEGHDQYEKKIAVATSDGTTEAPVEVVHVDLDGTIKLAPELDLSSSVITDFYLYWDSTLAIADNTNVSRLDPKVGITDLVAVGPYSAAPPATAYNVPDFLTGWDDGKRQMIKIDHSNLDTGNLENFPVNVRYSTSMGIDNVDMTEFFTIMSTGANRKKIAFTDEWGTELNAEIDSYSISTNLLVLHVSVPIVTYGQDTIIWAYIDMTQASNSSIGDIGDPAAQAVWDVAGYQGVWHMSQGGGSTQLDSTSNANNGSPNNLGASNSVVDAHSTAINYNGSNEYHNVGDKATLKPTDALSIEAWVQCDNWSHNTYMKVINKYNGGTSLCWQLMSGNSPTGTTGYFVMSCRTAAGTFSASTGANPLPEGQYHWVGGSWDQYSGIVMAKANDDTPGIATDKTTPILSNTSGVRIATDVYDNNYWDGKIGEVRFADVPRLENWFTMGNYNIRDTLLYVGALTEYDPGLIPPIVPTESDIVAPNVDDGHAAYLAFAGDLPVNTIPGDMFYELPGIISQDSSWGIIQEVLSQDIAWTTLTDAEQDIAWDILTAVAQGIAWTIYYDMVQNTSWSIFPAAIGYIQNFCLKWVQYEFGLVKDSKDPCTDPDHKLKHVKYNFEIVEPIKFNFKITRVWNTNIYYIPNKLET